MLYISVKYEVYRKGFGFYVLERTKRSKMYVSHGAKRSQQTFFAEEVSGGYT